MYNGVADVLSHGIVTRVLVSHLRWIRLTAVDCQRYLTPKGGHVQQQQHRMLMLAAVHCR